MVAPPKETMQSLRVLIIPSLTNTPSSQIIHLLTEHKHQLLSHIHPTVPPTESEIRYRSNLPTTKSHPKPTPAETQWLAAHKLPLPKHLAALHLRDYLHATYPTNAHTLLRSPSLVPYISAKSLIQFARDEIQAAYHVIFQILNHPENPSYTNFLDENTNQVRDAIVKAANALLSPAKPEHPHLSPEPYKVLALLLTCTTTNFLSLSHTLPILKAYITASSPLSDYSLQALQNDPLLTYLLAAAITTAIRQNPTQLTTHIDSFRPLLTDKHTLPALVSLSLASILRLNNSNPHAPPAPHPDPSNQFMTHALSSDALEKLRLLLQYSLPTTHAKPLKLMFRAFMEDLLSFISAFPPRSLQPSQIEHLSRLLTGFIEASPPAPVAHIANTLWDDAHKSPLAHGLESILHLSSALYPLSFRPLISLLRVLAVDKRSAAHTVNFLENTITTICESAEGYADAIIALDEDEDVIWDKLRDYSHDYSATRSLKEVNMGENMVFVQAMREIPGGTYRSALPAGVVGLGDDNFTIVAWIHPWNGFDAIVYALDTLHDILCTDVPPSPDFRTVVEDLVESAIEALGFLQQVAWNGSHTLRQHLCDSFRVVDTTAGIVAEILQMKGKASFSSDSLQALLRSASTCLPALVGDDAKLANRVASILSDAVKRPNFASGISSFGETAVPVLAAFACINSALADESFPASADNTMMDCIRSGEGVDVYKEVVTNMLCSGNLPNSMAVSLERKSTTEWLLPLWSMRLLQSRPEAFLSSTSAALLFATTVVTTASHSPLSESECLLYPTMCEAVAACVNALRHRSKGLGSPQENSARRPGSGKESKSTNKLTALEEVLLRPDVVEAMAIICCGGAKRLQDDEFYSGWIDSEDRYLLPVQERTKSNQPYDMHLCYAIADCESTADLWLSGMVTRCLSLQMDCLSHFEKQEGIPQIPWPSSSSTLDTDTGVGAMVRERIAKRISEGYTTDLLGFLVAILSCRQRAASRSLFGPRQSSKSNSNLLSCATNDSRQKAEEDKDAKPNDQKEHTDPIPAVIFSLRQTFESYKKLLREHAAHGSNDKHRFLKRGGQLSRTTASCVRILRLGLVSQNSRWFRDYIESDFWKLLTSLVRCGSGGDESNPFDIQRTTQDWYAYTNIGGLSKISGLNTHQHLVLNAEQIFDIASIWKGIAADVFHITSREILAEATEALLTTRSDESDSDCGLQDSLFRKPLFRSFANAFSETWATTLLGTEHIREATDRTGLPMASQDAKRVKAAPTLKQLVRQLSTRIREETTRASSNYDVLSEFDRCGDLAVPYGASYAFDVSRLRQFLASKNISESLRDDLIVAVMDLNFTIGRQDVYVEVLSSFSSMASIVLFVDSLCPTLNLRLSYSSPQFGGKLCRYLPRVVTSLLPDGALSWHFVTVSLEVSKLLSVLSTGLTKEEFEQSALTSMRHGDALEVPAELHLSTPLGHICHIINRIVSTENNAVWSLDESRSTHKIISWLLLTASRYANGSAFHSSTDLQALVRSCVRTLKMVNGTSDICAAVSTALTEAIVNMSDDLFVAAFTNGVLSALLSAVDTTANNLKGSDQRSHSNAIAGLLQTLTRALMRLRNIGNTDTLVSLREINASGVQPLLPTKGQPVEIYDIARDERNASHAVWCSVLQLAAVAISSQLDPEDADMIESDDMRYVVEFCSMHLERIVEDSLDLQKRRGEVSDRSPPHAPLNFQAATLGKVEEAELAAIVLSRLSPFGLVLQNAMPKTIRHALEQLCRYTAQATRILRTDPIERWVRPVTQREQERSGVAMEQLSPAVGAVPIGQSTPKSPSPGRRLRSPLLTPKKSPSQALRAAMSGKARQGVTPSPGSVLTPFMSPMPNAKAIPKTPLSFSQNSPWGSHGSGLITKTGQCFAAEVSMSLIRGLCAALVAIRQLSEHLGIYPFQPTMEAIGDVPGIGTLLAILKFACWELNREGDADQRACIQGIADTAMHLTLSHAMRHAETGALPQSVRDEVRKRVTTTLYRANHLVPPLPTTSILRDDGLMSLWKRF